jgi:hypothetical protein
MDLLELFRWLEANLPGGAYLRESVFGFSILLTLHVVFMCIFFGLLTMMDLRLVGVGNLRTKPWTIQAKLFPWYVFGFTGMAITGVLLFYAQPLRYFGKTFFWWKLGLMVLAGLNAAMIHYLTQRSEAAWESRQAKFAGAASLLLWTLVLVLGRLTAYEWFTTEYF